MRDVRGGDGAREREAVHLVGDALEEACAAPEQGRNEVQIHLLDEPGREILPRDGRAARERDVLAAGFPPPACARAD